MPTEPKILAIQFTESRPQSSALASGVMTLNKRTGRKQAVRCFWIKLLPDSVIDQAVPVTLNLQ
jgi:hypothetical protein